MALSDFKQFEAEDALFRNSKGKVKQPPALPSGVRVADTHCHLGMLENTPLALARAAFHGLDFLECITDPAEANDDEFSSQQIYQLLPTWQQGAEKILQEWGVPGLRAPRVRIAAGVHPHNAKDWKLGEPVLMELLKDPLTSCIGEIGLDYHYDMSPRAEQREIFAIQLQLAHKTGLPVALHIREAHKDALDILRSEGVPAAGCILHCFNLGPEDVRPFVELGCYVALGGPLTFKKERATRAAVVQVPLERLLTETDSPYMAPEPLRGTVCLPCQTTYTLRVLLDCFGYSGNERALELFSPRSVDVAEGEQPKPLVTPDFSQLQDGLSELEFCERLYTNATELLDRPNPLAKVSLR